MVDAIKIYNSNTNFLIHHIGEDYIDESFLKNELDEMQAHGFSSNYLCIDNEPIGIVDYMLNDEGYVYLSLLMFTKEKQKNGCVKVGNTDMYYVVFGKIAKFILVSCGARLAPFDIA